jgi:hypothetical protein
MNDEATAEAPSFARGGVHFRNERRFRRLAFDGVLPHEVRASSRKCV